MMAQSVAAAATASFKSGVTALVALDATNVAAGLADGGVAIWNGRDAAPSMLSPHKTRVLAVGKVSGGQQVVSVAIDGTLAVTPVAKGAAGRTGRIDLGASAVRGAVFSPDGTRLVAGSEFGDVRVFDVESGKLRHTFRGHLTEIQDLAVDPRSATIASAGADADLRLWDATGGRSIGHIAGDLSNFAVAFSPSDGTLASGGPDRKVTLRDGKTFKETGTFALKAPLMVAALAWSPDGRLLAVGDIDDGTLSKGGLQVIDAARRTVVSTLTTGGAPPSQVTFFADGTRLAASFQRAVRVWPLSA